MPRLQAPQDGLSEYELERRANIERNEQFMVENGLKEAASDVGKKGKAPRAAPQKRARREPQKPSRSSRRLVGEAADDVEIDGDALEAFDALPDVASRREGLANASKKPRLTATMVAALDAMEEASSAPLDDEEVAALEQVRAYLKENTEGGKPGKDTWQKKRALLQEAVEMLGPVRWPSWLAGIEAKVTMGKTDAARHQTMCAAARRAPNAPREWSPTMPLLSRTSCHRIHVVCARTCLAARRFAIERAACGLGLDYARGWPAGIGVLLSNDVDAEGVAEPARPRLLTLGGDTERLRREGQRLEHRFGRDLGNGWVYNHALGKLREYQLGLLGLDKDFEGAPSVAQLEAEEQEE